MNLVSENETAESRGRISAHDFPLQINLCNNLSSRMQKKIKLKRLLMRLGLPYQVWRNLSKHDFYHAVSNGIHRHYYSYNKLSRPIPVYQGDRMNEPRVELNENMFYEAFGFWKVQFLEIVDNLILMPIEIKAVGSHAKTNLSMGIYVMLCRWQVADT